MQQKLQKLSELDSKLEKIAQLELTINESEAKTKEFCEATFDKLEHKYAAHFKDCKRDLVKKFKSPLK